LSHFLESRERLSSASFVALLHGQEKPLNVTNRGRAQVGVALNRFPFDAD
jgi:hypothetical protein